MQEIRHYLSAYIRKQYILFLSSLLSFSLSIVDVLVQSVFTELVRDLVKGRNVWRDAADDTYSEIYHTHRCEGFVQMSCKTHLVWLFMVQYRSLYPVGDALRLHGIGYNCRGYLS